MILWFRHYRVNVLTNSSDSGGEKREMFEVKNMPVSCRAWTKHLSQVKSFEFWTSKERLLFISRYVLSLRRGNWKSWTSSAEISVHMCANVCLFWVLGQRFIASMHTHACTHTSHTHGKQWCRDPSMSTSQAQPSIHFSQWPRNEWQDKQKPPHQVYKFYHRSESV